MRLTSRRLAPGELDHELIWLSVSISALGLATTWLAASLPWPRCLFHDLTGHPCVTCGATRSTIQFFHGHFFAALRWNPLVFAVLCALSIFDAYAFVALVMRTRRLRISHLSAREKKFGRAFLVTALAANWAYLLIANPTL